jgi:hypothetical protein
VLVGALVRAKQRNPDLVLQRTGSPPITPRGKYPIQTAKAVKQGKEALGYRANESRWRRNDAVDKNDRLRV